MTEHPPMSGPRTPRRPIIGFDGQPLRAVVIDEPGIADVLAQGLALNGWDCRTAYTIDEGVQTAAEFSPHVVVLDVTLPDGPGLDAIGALKSISSGVHVLVLSARATVEDRVAGLRSGADDYVTKPFSLTEVSARLVGLARQAGQLAGAGVELVVGELALDDAAHEVRRGDTRIELTPTEFALLRYLMHHPRRVLSKQQILHDVWGYDFGTDAHIVEQYIAYLRKKIDHTRAPMIHTVRGHGYLLRPATSMLSG